MHRRDGQYIWLVEDGSDIIEDQLAHCPAFTKNFVVVVDGQLFAELFDFFGRGKRVSAHAGH